MDSYENEVILFFGPPHVGKTLYYKQCLMTSHDRICPSELFHNHPQMGLHDVILTATNLLLQGKKVIIDDDNWSAKLRHSYINGIKKKVPCCQFLILSFTPKFGKTQLLWLREFSLAHMYLHDQFIKYNIAESNEKIFLWSINSSQLNYPSPKEVHKIVQVQLGLKCESYFKFEVPVLILQWEGLSQDSKVIDAIGSIIHQWYKHNPGGRNIILKNGNNKDSEDEIRCKMKNTLAQLCEKLDDCPIYLCYIKNNGLSGSFIDPPNPGSLAWLQRLHHLDFSAKASVFLYHDNAHMKMAEAAGLKYAKISSVASRPYMIISGRFTAASKPHFNESVKLIMSSDNIKQPELPLFKQIQDSGSNFIWQDAEYGRFHGLSVKNFQILKKYRQLYIDNATTIHSSESLLTRLEKQLAVKEEPSNTSNFSTKKRTLLNWMLPSPKPKITSEVLTGSCSLKPTFYVMSEKELLDEAYLVYQEAMENKSAEDSANEMSKINEKVILKETTVVIPKLNGCQPDEIPINERLKDNLFSDQRSPESKRPPQVNEVFDKTQILLEPLFLNEKIRKPPPKKRLKITSAFSCKNTVQKSSETLTSVDIYNLLSPVTMLNRVEQEETLLINSCRMLKNVDQERTLLINPLDTTQIFLKPVDSTMKDFSKSFPSSWNVNHEKDSSLKKVCIPNTVETVMETLLYNSNEAAKDIKSKPDFSFLDKLL